MSDFGGLGFAVLGTVRVYRDGAELKTGPPQRRSVLALLLAGAGDPVSLDAIAAALWPVDPPPSAANVVYRHINALRTLLDPGLPLRAEGQHVVRGAAGYRLRIPEGALDLTRFRRLADRAGRLAAGSDSATSVDLYLAALAEWQGAAAGDIPAEVRSHQMFAALEDERLRVVRKAADTALRGGPADRARTGRVTEVLRDTVAGRPLDESLQARLLLLLAAGGHRTEALAAFEAIRGRLAAEHGLEPGHELRDAHARVTAGGAGAAVESPEPGGLRHGVRPARTAGGALPPLRLPLATTDFTGRDDEVNHVLGLLNRRTDGRGQPATVLISALDGLAGVGRTALVVQLAHRLTGRFPEGTLYLDLRGFDPSLPPVSVADALRDVLGALGVPGARIPATVDARAALYRTVLADRRVLLVLDNATDAEQVRPLLPGNGGCLVLVTSRHPLLGLVVTEGAHPLTLDFPARRGHGDGAGPAASSGRRVTALAGQAVTR